MLTRIALASLVGGLLSITPATIAAHAPVPEPEAGTLIVLNKGEDTASLIDRGSGKEVVRLDTGNGPHEVAVSPDGRTAVACNYGTRGAPGRTLTVIDLVQRRVAGTIDLGRHTMPHGIAFLPDGKRVVVTTEGSGSVVVADIEKGEVRRAVETGAQVSHMLAVTPDGSRVFVANIGSGSVTVIDLEKGERLGTIATGRGAEGIDVSPDGREVWVTNRQAYTVSVIDARTLDVLAEIPCGQFPIRARFTPDGEHVLVTCARSGDVAVFDASERREVHRVAMELDAKDGQGRLFGDQFGQSPVPIGVLIPPDGARAYIANAQADVIAVVDLERWKVVDLLKAGREPDGMAWSPILSPDSDEKTSPAEDPNTVGSP